MLHLSMTLHAILAHLLKKQLLASFDDVHTKEHKRKGYDLGVNFMRRQGLHWAAQA
jgi:hypothetical protein